MTSPGSELKNSELKKLGELLRLTNPAALEKLGVEVTRGLQSAAHAAEATPARPTATDGLLDKPLAEVSFRVFDLEMTGLSMAADEVIEIAISEVRGGKVTPLWQSLIRPRIEVPPRIFELTGIEPAVLAAAPRAGEVFAALSEALAGDCLVAHNARYDIAHLQQLAWQYDPHWLLPPHVCSLKLSRKLLPELDKWGLQHLAEQLHLPLPAHRAAADTVTTAALLQVVLDRAAQRGAQTLRDLVQLESERKPKVPPARIAAIELDAAPAGPGVYRFSDEQEHTLYVGYSRQVQRRLREHLIRGVSHQSAELVKRATHVAYEAHGNALDAYLREREWIAEHRPKLNARNAEHGRVRYFRLTNSGGLSIASLDTREGDDVIWLGPLVLARAERLVLRALREYFGLASRPKRNVYDDPGVQKLLDFIADHAIADRPEALDPDTWELLLEVRRALRRTENERIDARRPFLTPTLVQGLPLSEHSYGLAIGRRTLALQGEVASESNRAALAAWLAAPGDANTLDAIGEAIVSFAHRHEAELQLSPLRQ